MPAFGFTIEETTGAQRRIVLRGRALPYRPVAWEGGQRTKITWYPGNPQATLQVLGPEETPTELGGMWKDRFLPGQVETQGFDEITTAEQLVDAFNDLRLSGNALRVQWGPMVREGVLQRFRAEFDRIEDVRWECTFEWFSQDRRAPRAAPEPDPVPTMRSATNAQDDLLAFEPPGLVPDFRAQVVDGIAGLRDRAGTIFDKTRELESLLGTPASALGAIASATEAIRSEAESELQRLLDVPATTLKATDRVYEVLKLESWRRSLGRSTHRFRAVAQRQERDLRQKHKPGALQLLEVSGNTSLRQIAFKAYGNADDWQIIADVNGITGSVVEAGTVLIIPARPPTLGGQRADLSA